MTNKVEIALHAGECEGKPWYLVAASCSKRRLFDCHVRTGTWLCPRVVHLFVFFFYPYLQT